MTAAIKFNGRRPYFDCAALHFLCHPPVLEHLNVFEFYSQYEVINKTRKNEEDLMEMINTQDQQPSFDQEKNRFIQGICERSKKKLVRFCQYDFAETKSFNGDILDSNMVINAPMEMYSRNLLLLFYPFHVKSDLVLEDSYTKNCGLSYNKNNSTYQSTCEFLTMYKIVKQIASVFQDSLMSLRKAQKCTVKYGIHIIIIYRMKKTKMDRVMNNTCKGTH